MKFLAFLLLIASPAFAGFNASRPNSGIPPFIGTRDAPSAAQAVTASSTTQIVATYVPVPLTITGIRFVTGVQSGYCQTGLLDATGAKLASSVETLCPAPGANTMSFVSPVSVLPGIYYLTVGADNTTQTFAKSSGSSVIGCAFVATNLPIASVTLPGTTTSNCFALVGIVSGGLSQ